MAHLKSQYDQAIEQLTLAGAPFETGQQRIDGVDYTVFTQAPGDLNAIYSTVAEHGDKEFLIYEGERWSFTQLLQQAASFGHQLINHYGIQKGDRVAIAMRNYPEWMSSFIAITAVGAVAVPLNSWGKAKELGFALEDAQAKVVFCDQSRLDLIAGQLGNLKLQAVLVRPEPPSPDANTLPANTITANQLIADLDTVSMPAVNLAPDDMAMMMYTSGTTGKPKGAPSTHQAICQAIMNFECAAMASAMSNPESIGAMLGKGFEPTQMLAVPLFHVSGCHAVFLTALKAGRKVVMLYKWDVERALDYIESERITILNAAPSMLLQLLESPLYDQTDTSSLFSVGGGGSATPPRASRLIEEKVPGGYPGTGWGLTETNALGTSFTGAPFKNKPGSAGFCHPIVEIEVRNSEGRRLPQGEAGELWAKSAALVKAYWNRPDANAKDFKNGWFNSGDIGYFDANDYLFLSDRAKDMIIRAGENIYPAEIEATLFDHPQVEEAAVFGVEDEQLGEQVAVAVVAKAGGNLSKQELIDFARTELAGYKVPHYVWILDQALPRTPSGKVLKKDLKSACLAHKY